MPAWLAVKEALHADASLTLPAFLPASGCLPAWPQDACFVLELVKQEQGKPKSMHFT